MQFKYGTYSHDVDSVGFVATKRARYGNRGQREGMIHSWVIRGELVADNTTDLLTEIANLENAYAADGYSAGLYLDDGTPTSHVIRSANAFGGTRVISGPNYPEGEGAQFAIERTFEIQLEFEVLDAGAELMSFTESVSQFGSGGPEIQYSAPIEGRPKPQIVRKHTPYRMTQSGEATGFSRYPTPPSPMFPKQEIADAREITRSNPDEARGNQRRGYTIRWSYSFLHSRAMNRLPTNV